MKNSFIFSLMAGGIILSMAGCTKSSSSSSSDLVGNWLSAPDFGGNGRSEAVAFTIGDKTYLTGGVNHRTR